MSDDDILDEDQVVAMINAKAAELGSRKALAQMSGSSPGHLAGIVNGDCRPGGKICDYFGLEPVVMFRRVGRSKRRGDRVIIPRR